MKRISAFLIVLPLLFPAQAHASRTVTSPYVDAVVIKLKSKTGITHDDERESRDGAWVQVFGAEYGVTERFSLEGEGDLENAGNDDNTEATSLALKAKVQFTEKGKYWLDAGARLTYEASLKGEADSAELKIIVAKDSEKFRHTANFIVSHEVGEDAADETEGGFSWSSRYKWKTAFEPGFEMYNNFGSLSDTPDFEDQDHSIGPVAYGKLGTNFKYEAGYLVGLSENAADGRFKFILEYAVKF